METSKDIWVKPFSTGLSCVDTISAECIKNVSVDECVNICNDSNICSYGYHVQLPNEKDSYCLPINGLPYMDNTDLFTSSLYPKEQGRIFSPHIGVELTTFQNTRLKNTNEPNPLEISQLNIYYLRYFTKNNADPLNRNKHETLYLQKDLQTWSNDRQNAAKIIVSRDGLVYTAASTRDPRIRNGNLVFLNIHTKNLIYIFINPQTHGFYPRSVRSSSSITYDTSNLYHTQIIKSVPFDDEPITVNDVFQVRVATVPINDHVYYWTMDTNTNTMIYEKVSRDNLLDPSNLDKYKRFSFEQFGMIDTGTENFLTSQLNYMLNNYYYPATDARRYQFVTNKKSKATINILYIIAGVFFTVLSIILLYKFRFKHRK